jgi:hypothetical protein
VKKKFIFNSNMKMFFSKLVTFFVIVQLISCTKNDNAAAVPEPALPTLNAPTITTIGVNSIVISGTISDSGHATISRKGFCWSKNPDPTLDSNFLNSRSTSLVSFTDTIKGLTYNTRYYIRAFAINSKGTAFSQTLSVQTRESSYSMGQNFGGGYVFYIDSTGEHGLIATTPIGTKRWAYWPYDHILIGTTSAAVGKGQANTQAIINSGNNDPLSAAKACDDLVVNGYNDWYLPSHEELVLLRQHKDAMPFFNIANPSNWQYMNLYWSSTEVNFDQVYLLPINAISSFSTDGKSSSWSVVPVRSF